MPDLALPLKNEIEMERIDLFDRYFNGELSNEDRIKFQERLESDEEFASAFKIYTLTVAGICKEAEQDNEDFGFAMNKLTKEQLFEIIGRRKRPLSREEIVNRLKSRIVLDRAQRTELSGMAALDNIEDDDYSEGSLDVKTSQDRQTTKDDSGKSLRRITFIFIAIVIALILLSILL